MERGNENDGISLVSGMASNYINSFMKIFLLLSALWFGSAFCVQAQNLPVHEEAWPVYASARKGARILFMGNSYTFFNRMPAMVMAMADVRGFQADVHIHAAPAASFKTHWNDEEARKKLTENSWNFVVLQDQSATPVIAPERTLEFGKKLCSQVRSENGTPVLFLTWGRKGASNIPDKGEQQALRDTYLKLARQEKAALAPVGIAWENCSRRHPEIKLYLEDGQHPSEQGSYLTACVMYCTLFGKSPVGLPGKLTLKGVRLCNIPQARAKTLQTIAQDTCKRLFTTPASARKKPEGRR